MNRSLTSKSKKSGQAVSGQESPPLASAAAAAGYEPTALALASVSADAGGSLPEERAAAQGDLQQLVPSALLKDAPLPEPIVNREPAPEKKPETLVATQPAGAASRADEPKPSAGELFPQRIWPD